MKIQNNHLQDWLTTLTCTLLSAALFYLSTGLGAVWPLAWIAPLPLLWLAYGKQPLWRIAIAAFAAFGLGNIGFLRPFAGMPAATIGITTAIIGLATAFVVAVAFGRLVQRRLGWTAALIAFPVIWTGIEYGSSLVSPNGTVGSLAYTQVGAPILIQSASLFGIWSVTFLLCLVANGGALALRNRQKSLPILTAVAAIFVLNILFGAVRLHQHTSTTTHVAVAAKDQQAQRFESTEAAWLAITTAYANGVNKLAKTNPDVTTVVLPEKIAILETAWRSAVLKPLADAARNNSVRIVAGFEDDSAERNIAITFEPDGTSSLYTKRHLLGAEQDLTPGDQPGILPGGAAVVICKDMDFPRMMRADAQHHIGILFVPAADFSVDRWMHSRIAVMRGVEGDYSVARAARKGDIQVSDNRGRILTNAASSQTFVSRTANAPVGTGKTIYIAIGDVFAWACLAATLVLAALVIRRPRTTQK